MKIVFINKKSYFNLEIKYIKVILCLFEFEKTLNMYIKEIDTNLKNYF